MAGCEGRDSWISALERFYEMFSVPASQWENVFGMSHDSPGGDKQNKQRKGMCADASSGGKINANNTYQVHFSHSQQVLRKY